MPELDRSRLAATPGPHSHPWAIAAGDELVECPLGCGRSTVRPAGVAAESRRKAYALEHERGWHDATA